MGYVPPRPRPVGAGRWLANTHGRGLSRCLFIGLGNAKAFWTGKRQKIGELPSFLFKQCRIWSEEAIRLIMKPQLLSFLATSMFMLGFQSITAESFTTGGFTYTTTSATTASVTAGGTGAVTIPATVTYNGTNYTVTGIFDWAFHNKGVTSISIPDACTNIGVGAFDGTTWYNNQPDGMVYIGKVAYKYKGTMADGTTVAIKAGTLALANYVFEGCTTLESVSIPNSVTRIGEFAFRGCTTLTSITIPSSVTTIGNSAFSGCTGLTNVVIPSSISTINSNVFFSKESPIIDPIHLLYF